MTDRLPYLPLWTDDYLTDTRHLTTVQHGAYLLLLMTAWRFPGCALPDDDKLLARWAGLNLAAWLHHKPTIMGLWDLRGDRWVQKRLARERNYCEALKKKKSEANRSNALKRWKPKMPAASQSDATPYPYPIIDTPDGVSIPPHPPVGGRVTGSPKPKAKVAETEPDTFGLWWSGYTPHLMSKGSRQDALKAYRKALQQGATPDELTRQRDAYLDQCRATDCKSKHASTWLNGLGWRETYDAGTPAGTSQDRLAEPRVFAGQRPEPPSFALAAQRAAVELQRRLDRERERDAGPLDREAQWPGSDGPTGD